MSYNVREATFDLLRQLGLTTIFGNPGSTEGALPAGFSSRLHLCAGPAGSLGNGDGRRLRAGD